MATEQQVIDQVRRSVADFSEPRRYENTYYLDAIGFALSKLSYDFSENYLSVPSVPNNRVFLLIKLAVIQMAYVRAGEDQSESSSGSSSSGDDIHSLSVPNLSVEGPQVASEKESSEIWFSLATKLQDEYDNELEHGGGSSLTAEVTSSTINRVSLTHGGLANRKLDMGLPGVMVSATVSGLTVQLSWDVLYSDLFNRYEVCRDTLFDMSTETLLSIITDNHDATYEDTVTAPGTYYYRVKTVNPNEIKTNSNTLSVIVT